VLNGSKMWITNGGLADVATVWARTDEGVRGFLVPRGTPGFSTTDVGRKLSLRASVTSALSLDDVRLPASAMLPEARGLRGPLSCLNEARFGILFGAVGAARDCLATALGYADTRVQNFAPACYPGQTLALGCAGGRQEVTGSDLTNAPKWSYTLAARYRHALENAPFDLIADASYSYRSSVFFTYRDPNARQPGYGLLNANLGLASQDGRYEIIAFARNLLDKQFVSGTGTGFLDNNAAGAGYTQTLTPDAFRRVGVEARVNF